MDDNMVRQLCVRALSRGVGSMEYVDSLLIMEDDDDDDDSGGNNFEEESEETTPTGSGGSQPPLREPAPDWCKCRHCQAMAQEIENKCVWIRKYSNCVLEIGQILGMTVKIRVHLLSAKLRTDSLYWKSMVV